MITVELLGRDKQRLASRLDFTVQNYSSDAIGGPVSASITATGPESALSQLRSMLGNYVILRNSNNMPVWWGMLDSATIQIGGISIGVALSDMRNRIKVNYTITDGDGYAIPVATEWFEHNRSVLTYGKREVIHTAGEMSPEGAVALAARELEKLSLPRQAVDLGRGDGATIRCKGLWSTLAWTYYGNPAGREVYDVGASGAQALGWGFTASDVGFSDRGLRKLSGGLDGAVEGDAIRITGSTSNDGNFVVEGSATDKATSYTANTIYFTDADDIFDDANAGLGFIKQGGFIKVSGSTNNSRYHFIDGGGRSHVTTWTVITGVIIAEAAGPAIQIEQGQTLPLDFDVTTEIPGASVTVTGYSKIAYSFTPTENVASWRAAEIWIRANKIGSPVDNLRVDLTTDVAGAPGAVLDFQTVTGATLLKNSTWIKFQFNSVADISFGTTYWIVVSRTGAQSGDNYYEIGVDEDIQRLGGFLKLYDGLAWVSRPVNAAMPFQVWGATWSTDQIALILANEGQFLNGYSMRTDTGNAQRQYRNGATDALYEIDKLIAEGTAAGNAILVRMTPEFHAIVETQPVDFDYPPVVLRRGPTLTTGSGTPLAEGVLPVGQWCSVDGVSDNASGLAPMSPFLIGFLEYDAVGGEISNIRGIGTDSVFNFARIAQG